ncbi:hypothetical protein RKE29_13255 [Streptomyces sp. B1866]|uniref:hypothetical protein n=1 Tax=Streptomyces sp. B1866 TaxID=3075431 RepID=UPI00288E116C|nr:hypothetical protein [Streptomyces sp. B1866]MDT3397607.1 hypothetical protein [Streptomyces sp. B1866]
MTRAVHDVVPGVVAWGGWAPPEQDHEMQPAGVWWDALRVPTPIGERALGILRERTGAVVEDPGGSLLYWFVRKGVTGRWDQGRLREVRLLGQDSFLVVPPLHRRGGSAPYWRVAPRMGRLLTDPERLRIALGLAVQDALGPHYCVGCGRETAEPIPFYREDTASGPGWTWRVCADCAPDYVTAEQARRLVAEHREECAGCRSCGEACATGRALARAHRVVTAKEAPPPPAQDAPPPLASP